MNLKKKTVTRLDSDYVHQYDAYIVRQKKKKQRLIRRLVLFSLIVVIAIGSMTIYHIKQRELQAVKSEQLDKLHDKLTTLKKEEEKLSEEVKLLNDEDYVLEIARTNYFFSKEGELIFNIPNKDPSY